MPELPEVETIMRGLAPHIDGEVIQDVLLRHQQLRWPIASDLKERLTLQTIRYLSRRGKYLLMHFDHGALIIHLGMSGSLRIMAQVQKPLAHDHMDIVFLKNIILRYTDPRRFGALLWVEGAAYEHPLLKSQGVEPLEKDFTAENFKEQAKNRRVPIKQFIMNSRIVVGIGNIYAAEALFKAKIHPSKPAGLLTISECRFLVLAIVEVLQAAIKAGGSTVKDFVNSEGKPGYFTQQLTVYGRLGLNCVQCQTKLQPLKLGQRNTVFCSQCQQVNW